MPSRAGAAFPLLALVAALASAAVPSRAPAATPDPNPLLAEEGSLLGTVDSATVSVLTVIAIAPPPARPVAGAKQRRLIGTGVASSQHHVITTASMAIQGGTFHAVLNGGEERTARLRGVDRASNVALFEVGGAPLPSLRRASPQSLAVGAWVAVIANVGVGRPQIMLGRVTGRGERVDYPFSGEVLELDAPAYPGSGGGAVLNESGEWVAVIVGRAIGRSAAALGAPGDPATSALPRQDEGVLVALPVDQLDRIAEDLDAHGAVRRGFLGIRLRRTAHGPDSIGIAVQDVVAGSPAERAGVRIGDVILAIDGEYVRTPEDLTARVRAMRPGDEVDLTISRGPDILPVHATLGAALPASEAAEGGGDAELESLKRRLERLEAETRAVRDRIRALQQPPRR
jgi:S1-C subfamily serine protease